ncbi:MAG TPA: ATPase, T2SS/T4P/T4SS family [Anaerolineae bacterium]|jgi:pilus assembly protein CpaF|nr:ATPase, T2SS/T4P/T4SS family [Anaerolineae bacterium]
MANWGSVQAAVSPEQLGAIVEQAARALSGLPLAALRNRRELGARADQAVRDTLRSFSAVTISPMQLQSLVAQVAAKVGGLGFLDALMPPNSTEFTDLVMNGDGRVWGRRKFGAGTFADLALQPSKDEAWRAIEALLAPEGRACSESTPTVDVKIPRDRELGFGGARVKVLHPCIAPGDGYPSLALRLFEPEPVQPGLVAQWRVFGHQPEDKALVAADGSALALTPAAVQVDHPIIDPLMDAIANRLRLIILGGTATGKTTLLSALCHGIPQTARIVKVEDPEEIWLPQPNVCTLEARPAPPGSNVPPYTVADGVDDAMRLAPAFVIVGEVRRGDAALSLFRALMSDHAGLTTFHAEGPEEAVRRMGVIMWADAGVRIEGAKELFAQALDIVVQIGWREGQRRALGVWEVAGLERGEVKFRTLWQPGDARLGQITRRRG